MRLRNILLTSEINNLKRLGKTITLLFKNDFHVFKKGYL